MRKKLMLMILAALLMLPVTAQAKRESGSSDAASTVLYGSPDGGSTIVPIKVTAAGAVSADMSAVGQSIIPATDNTYYLGSGGASQKRFAGLYSAGDIKIGDYVSATSFTGVIYVDSVSEIQAAINLIEGSSAQGGTIYILPGSYTLTTPLLIGAGAAGGSERNIEIKALAPQGHGGRGVTLIAPSGQPAIIVGNEAKSFANYYTKIDGIYVYGAATPVAGTIGIKLINNANTAISNFRIRGCAVGLWVYASGNGGSGQYSMLNHFTNFGIYNNTVGILISNGHTTGATFNNGNTFSDFYINSNNTDIQLIKTALGGEVGGNKFINAYIEVTVNTNVMLDIQGATTTRFIGCSFDGVSGGVDQIKLDSASTYTQFIGCSTDMPWVDSATDGQNVFNFKGYLMPELYSESEYEFEMPALFTGLGNTSATNAVVMNNSDDDLIAQFGNDRHVYFPHDATVDGDLYITTPYTLPGGDQITQQYAGVFDFLGVGGSDDTDLRIDADGTWPILLSITDDYVEVNDKLLTSFGSKLYKYAVADISYMSATEPRVTGWGASQLSVGLAGVDEIGATEGYVTLGEAADYLLFTMRVPSTFVDVGAATDLVIQFDMLEVAAEEVNVDVRIFEYGNTTPIVTDTVVVANGAARAWNGLVTLSTGIGAVANIDADDILLIEVTATADADDVNIYGARLKYRTGLEATQ